MKIRNGKDDSMKCPVCAEEIKAEAKKCKHCGEWLTSEDSTSIIKSAEPQKAVKPEPQNVERVIPGATSANPEIVGKKCRCCKGQIEPEGIVVLCPVCKGIHHAECWQENGKCTTPGCMGFEWVLHPPTGERRSVFLVADYAPIWMRGVAVLIDLGLLYAALILVGLCFIVAARGNTENTSGASVFAIVSIVLIAGYLVGMVAAYGATIGKMVFRLRIILRMGSALDSEELSIVTCHSVSLALGLFRHYQHSSMIESSAFMI